MLCCVSRPALNGSRNIRWRRPLCARQAQKNLSTHNSRGFRQRRRQRRQGRAWKTRLCWSEMPRFMQEEGIELGATLASDRSPPSERGNRRRGRTKWRAHRPHCDCRHAEKRRKGSHRTAARRRHRHRDDHRRQPVRPQRQSRGNSISISSLPKCSRKTRRGRFRASERK